MAHALAYSLGPRVVGEIFRSAGTEGTPDGSRRHWIII